MKITLDMHSGKERVTEAEDIRLHLDRDTYVDVEPHYGRLRLRIQGDRSRAFIIRPDCSNVIIIGDERL